MHISPRLGASGRGLFFRLTRTENWTKRPFMSFCSRSGRERICTAQEKHKIHNKRRHHPRSRGWSSWLSVVWQGGVYGHRIHPQVDLLQSPDTLCRNPTFRSSYWNSLPETGSFRSLENIWGNEMVAGYWMNECTVCSMYVCICPSNITVNLHQAAVDDVAGPLLFQ